MQHPDFTSQLARERQARFHAAAGRNRLTRADRNGDGPVAGSGSDPRAKPSFGRAAIAHVEKQLSGFLR